MAYMCLRPRASARVHVCAFVHEARASVCMRANINAEIHWMNETCWPHTNDAPHSVHIYIYMYNMYTETNFDTHTHTYVYVYYALSCSSAASYNQS